MKYKITWIDKKTPDWNIVNIVDPTGVETKEVSINKTSKKGEVFPGFDDMAIGIEISGEPWASPAGKNYLFPPKPEGSKGGGMAIKTMEIKAGKIAEAQQQKAKNIEDAQYRTSWMHAKNNACLLYANDRIGSKLDNEDEVLAKILSFATRIHNGEPTEPF